MESKPKIAVFIMCSGNFFFFLENFYRTAEKFLFPNCDKTYFIFTDHKRCILAEEFDNIKLIDLDTESMNSKKYGNLALMKFQLISHNSDLFEGYDYIWYSNLNVIFTGVVPETYLPTDDKLVLVEHISPLIAGRSYDTNDFEKNPKSAAFVPREKFITYVYGGVNFGKTKPYLEYVNECLDGVERDLDNGVIAKWHDESHTNRYLSFHPEKCKVLYNNYDSFVSPQQNVGLMKYQEMIKMIFLEKSWYGGHAMFRSTDEKVRRDIKFRDDDVEEWFIIYFSGNIEDTAKIRKNVIFCARSFKSGYIACRTKNKIGIIWDNGGLEYFRKFSDGSYRK